MKVYRAASASLFLTLAVCMPATAQDAKPKPSVLITNARICGGQHEALVTAMSVRIEGNKIARIGKSIPAPSGVFTIDAKGHTLTPGLIDAHVHLMWNLSPAGMFYSPPDYLR